MAEPRDETTVSLSYKETLNLPVTNFPMRPNAKVDDPLLIERWKREGLYERAMEHNKGKAPYILHDGPPYANGHIHLGHAYNKILKDIITKAYRMAGYHVPVTPGWDCHGLPIELKVVKELTDHNPVTIKRACRLSAQKWIEVQREEFRRLGIIMDWEHPYLTMSFDYEAATLRAFGICHERGFIKRNYKTVAWCTSCETTLASAEIEYADRKDPSIYCVFPLTAASCQQLGLSPEDKIGFLVWTTTPWTLPLNRAVALKPQTDYALVRLDDRLVIVGDALVPALSALLKKELTIVATIPSDRFAGVTLHHPFIAAQTLPIIFDESVGTDEGTACVHIAPGCGPIDYELAVRNGIEVYSPISSTGRYTQEILPTELAGLSVVEGQGWVIRALEAAGTLIHKGVIQHSYPHCWRCHNGLIFRATKQWFFDLQHRNLQDATLSAIDQITFIPPHGKQSLHATVAHRWEWCLSRQRIWGIPIPALLCQQCDYALLDDQLIERVAAGIAESGVEFWDTVAITTLIGDKRCPHCAAATWIKGTDILDVWFDSGISHYAVLATSKPSHFPADIYLEGSDQYRGWFQSSLLTSMAIEGAPAMRSIMTHGFTVDDKGRKMSKSLGNGVEPQTLIDRLGTDGLRLWVSTISNEGDVVVSETLLKNVEQVYRKIRNSCRFMLQNLFDFDASKDMVATEQLLLFDRYALVNFAAFHERMRAAYKNGDFTLVFHSIADYCTTELSALYFDVVKDRLYVEVADGFERRSAQTVLWLMLDGMTRLIAPILSFTAEQIADSYQHSWQGSIHLQPFASYAALLAEPHTNEDQAIWAMLRSIRDALMKLLEEQRAAGTIKHSLEAAITLSIGSDYAQFHDWSLLKKACGAEKSPDKLSALLQELCVVSQVTLVSSAEGLQATELTGVTARVSVAPGVKCPRCWRWQESTAADGLCDRCRKIMTSLSAPQERSEL